MEIDFLSGVCSDITYIKVKGEFAIGVAIDESICIEVAKEALRKYGTPEVMHPDRGKQFVERR